MRIATASSYQEKDMTAFSLDLIGRVKNGKFFLLVAKLYVPKWKKCKNVIFDPKLELLENELRRASHLFRLAYLYYTKSYELFRPF